MLSEKQVRELKKQTPEALRKPGSAPADTDPRAAALVFLAAQRGDISAVKSLDETLKDWQPNIDPKLGKYPAFGALALLARAESQARWDPPTSISADEPLVRSVDPLIQKAALLWQGTLRVEPESGARIKDLSAELQQRLTRREALEAEIRAEDELAIEVFKDIRAVLCLKLDPSVAAGYWHDPSVDVRTRRETTLLWYLNSVFGVEPLVAIAMVGGLRCGDVAVAVDHEKLDTIFGRVEQHQKRHRRRIKKSQESGLEWMYLTREDRVGT